MLQNCRAAGGNVKRMIADGDKSLGREEMRCRKSLLSSSDKSNASSSGTWSRAHQDVQSALVLLDHLPSLLCFRSAQQSPHHPGASSLLSARRALSCLECQAGRLWGGDDCILCSCWVLDLVLTQTSWVILGQVIGFFWDFSFPHLSN